MYTLVRNSFDCFELEVSRGITSHMMQEPKSSCCCCSSGCCTSKNLEEASDSLTQFEKCKDKNSKTERSNDPNRSWIERYLPLVFLKIYKNEEETDEERGDSIIPLEGPKYGERMIYDPSWNGPIKQEKRVMTDLKYLVQFAVYIIVWSGIGCYAYFVAESKSLPDANQDGEKNHDLIGEIRIFNVIGLLAMNIALSAIYVVVLRKLTKCIVYVSIFIIGFLTFCIIWMFIFTRPEHSEKGFLYLLMLILCSVVAIILMFVFLAFRKNINIACGVIEESCKMVAYFPILLMYPLITFIIHMLNLAFVIHVVGYLIIIAKSEEGVQTHIYLFHLINLFGFIWMRDFIRAIANMVLSNNFATWYWTTNKKSISCNSVQSSVLITLRYHLGTAAFGSMIMFLCSTPKMLFKALKVYTNKSCLFRWIQVLLDNVQKLSKYVNQNAYLLCAVHGNDLLQSAKDAFELHMRNVSKIIVATEVTAIIFSIANFVVIFITSLISLAYFQNDDRNTILVNMGLIVFGSVLAMDNYFSLLKIGVETTFYSVLEDYERNDGSPDKPYFMSNKLKNLLIIDSNQS